MPSTATTLTIVSFAVAGVVPIQAQHIVATDSGPVLVLPAEMQAALSRFDPGFRPRQLSDYPPWIVEFLCSRDPEECQPPLSERQALFAVVGDFNGDQVLDAVVDGDDGTIGSRLVIMSDGDRFSIERFHPLTPVPAEIREFRSRLRDDSELGMGVDQGLGLVVPGTITSRWEPEPLVLTTDAFSVSYFEKASGVYYYRDGAWHHFTITD